MFLWFTLLTQGKQRRKKRVFGMMRSIWWVVYLRMKWFSLQKHARMHASIHACMHALTHARTHTHTQLFYGSMDFVRNNLRKLVPQETFSQYQKKHSPTYTYRGHESSRICFIHLLWSMASSLFNHVHHASDSLCAQSLSQVFFGLPLGLAPSTSYSIHFFTVKVREPARCLDEKRCFHLGGAHCDGHVAI